MNELNVLKFFKPDSSKETYKAIVNEAMRLTRAEYGAIFLYRDNELYRVHASTPLLYQITPRSKGYTRTTLKKRTGYLIQAESGKINPLTLQLLSVQSDIAITMMDGNKPIGILTVMSKKPHRLGRKDYHAIKKLIPWISQAVVSSMRLDEKKGEIEDLNLIISMTAHELKSPLTSIYGLTQIMESMTIKKKTVNTEMVHKLLANEKRLIHLIEELLMMSRSRKGEFQYSMGLHDLREIINRAIVEFGFSYPKHHLEFINTLQMERVEVQCDFDKMIQVFVNILNNAGKYSSATTVIRIVLLQENNYYRIDVHDEGVGIPREKLGAVFKPFFRVESAKKERTGLGLGLYLTKMILDTHEAKINISSKEHMGTSVSVLLKRV